MVSTFNMGNKRADKLESLVPHEKDGFDIVALGFQESIYDMNVETLGKMLESREDLANSINKILGREYVLLEHNKRAQLQLIIFIKRQLYLEGIHSEVLTSAENTGFLHLLPNKGGVCISFRVFGTLLAFVSCHLTAHEGVANCALRNQSIEEILGGIRSGFKEVVDPSVNSHHIFFIGDMNYRTTFDKRNPGDLDEKERKALVPQVSTTSIVNEPMEDPAREEDVFSDDDDGDGDGDDLTNDDLPLTSGKSTELLRVCDLIANRDWSSILNFDELNRELNGNRVLCGFTALTPDFPPTFKRLRHVVLPPNRDVAQVADEMQVQITKEALASVSLKATNNKKKQGPIHPALAFYHGKRLPSYTDRILYKSLPGFASQLLVDGFESVEAMTSSDHKPVRAFFRLETSLGALGIATLDSGEASFQIRVHNLRGHNLKEMDLEMFGGLSDPYLVAFTDPTALINQKRSRVKTDIVTHNINPEWNDALILEIATTDYDGLKDNAHLFLAVWDHDITKNDDLIGVLALSFRDMLDFFHDKKPFHFREYILNNSLRCGEVSGTIEVSEVTGILPDSLKSTRTSPARIGKEISIWEMSQKQETQVTSCTCSVS